MQLSTATPELLPEIEPLRRLTKAIAAVEAIICPEWDGRYYSYDSNWAPGEEMASMRNGCGDDWFLLFDRNGAALKGFAHECRRAGDSSFPELIQRTVPPVFASFLHESAFKMDEASFCIWRRIDDTIWSVVSLSAWSLSAEEDGSGELLALLDGKPRTYQTWAADYYEQDVSLAAVEAIYAHQELNDDLVRALNPNLVLSDVAEDLREIGYPLTCA